MDVTSSSTSLLAKMDGVEQSIGGVEEATVETSSTTDELGDDVEFVHAASVVNDAINETEPRTNTPFITTSLPKVFDIVDDATVTPFVESDLP